jgi:hypothetical protein
MVGHSPCLQPGSATPGGMVYTAPSKSQPSDEQIDPPTLGDVRGVDRGGSWSIGRGLALGSGCGNILWFVLVG